MSNPSIRPIGQSGQVLPSGTVTFLFTDIEGSTELARAHPETWESARARHHSILQSAIDTHSGHVFQIIGDAFCVAFHKVGNGLHAAIEAQQKLQVEDWGESPIRVRMGLHTGSAELQGHEYRGYLTMASVQRVMSVAYGGQILLSNACARLIQNELPEGITLRDMKQHRLKGLPNPERLWQVIAPDLRQDYPPLQSLMDVPNNLPVQLSTFIGREKEVGQIKQRLEKNRLVTLTGSGGVGKTRLSIRVASELLNEYPNGAWMVELAPITDPDLVSQAICTSLDITLRGNTSPVSLLTEYLGEKKLLLVVDNCEHLIETCAQISDSLLHACPNLHILASSREALGVDGEGAYHVPSLSVPDPKNGLTAIGESESVKLFVERAAAALPDFQLTESNASYVAQICKRLDGVALAIELAASRVKLLNVEQIASRLDDAFRLLTGGSRTSLPRQQTLRALIDWSYNLLSDQEQRLFRRLAVFVGGWTLEAAESVCSSDGIEPEEVLDLLGHLVDKSLVVVDQTEGSRYRMLETIRQYAREKLVGTSRVDSIHKRHSEWFLRFAERADHELKARRDEYKWYNLLEDDLGNFRIVLAWLFETGTFEEGALLSSHLGLVWGYRNYFQEERYWMETALQHRESLSRWTVAALLRSLGRILTLLGERDLGIKYCRESLAIFRDGDDKFELAYALHILGVVIDENGNNDEAIVYYNEAQSLYRDLGYKVYEIEMIFETGWRKVDLGNTSEGFTILDECLKSMRELNVPSGLSYILWALAICRWRHNEPDEAEKAFKESLIIEAQIGNKAGMYLCLAGLAGVVSLREQPEQAARLFGIAEKGLGTAGVAASPFLRNYLINPVIASIRRQLEDEKFERARQESSALTTEQAYNFMLEVANE